MFKNHDLWLGACLGIFGFFAARTCHQQLSAIRAATEISLDEGKDGSENDESRYDPSLKSLARLAVGPNLRTREAAAKVIEDMVLQHQTYSLMLDHIAGNNEKLRDEALVCLRFLYANRRPKYPDPYISTHISIIKCLCNLNFEAYEYETAFRETGHGYRTPPYSDALEILLKVLKLSTNDYGLLAWLAIYPFGGHSTARDKKESIQKLMSNEHREESMYAMVQYALETPLVEEGLIRRNLIDRDMRDRYNLTRSSARQTGVSDNAVPPHQRRSRRQRREAAVLGHIGRPLEEEDIFMPNNHDTETVPMDPSLSPGQSQPVETGNFITAAGTEIVSGLLTPEPESEASSSE